MSYHPGGPPTVSVSVSPELKARLVALAELNGGLSLSELVRQALEEFLNKHERPAR